TRGETLPDDVLILQQWQAYRILLPYYAGRNSTGVCASERPVRQSGNKPGDRRTNADREPTGLRGRGSSLYPNAPAGGSNPLPDWTSHYRSAAEYFAVGELAELAFSVSSALDQPGPTSAFGQGQQRTIATIKEVPTGEQGALALLRELGIDPDEIEEEEEDT